MMPVLSYVALGGNQQDPELQLNKAIEFIAKIAKTKINKISSFYQTKPTGVLDQPDFINAVIEITTRLTPEQVLSELMHIEKQLGKIKTVAKNGPRIIDLDLLLYGDVSINTESLIVPHPRMWQRAFVLVPLLEIAPCLQNRIVDFKVVISKEGIVRKFKSGSQIYV